MCKERKDDVNMSEAEQLLGFLTKATSPFHGVEEMERQLKKGGFRPLTLGEEWELKPGGAYYFIQHGSSLIAFRIGEHWKKGKGFRIGAAHTDFPGFRIKPNPDMTEEGYGKVNVEVYGGVTLNTWMDRPLSAAGRVALKGKDAFHPMIKLVDFKRPIMTIPNLAIHLRKELNKGVELNKQTDMIPITGMVGENVKHYFISYLAKELGVVEEDILDYELYVYCAEEGCTVGLEEEFISAPRLDNMTSVQAILQGLLEAGEGDCIQVGAFFDHEEIGSKTKQGAGSMLLSFVIEKIVEGLGGARKDYIKLMEESILLSVDVGHGFHPSHGGKYDPMNKAVLNSGVTIKEAAAQSYATDCKGVAIILQLCKENKIPFKKFVNRSDGTSGSTLGSIASSFLPMITVEVGVPLLAMHSARELMGIKDQKSLTDLVRAFYTTPCHE